MQPPACIDATGLVKLQLSPHTGASSWAWHDTAAAATSQRLRPRTRTSADRSRLEIEAEAASEFVEAGGESAGRGAEVLAWRQAFVRRRLTAVVRGAQGVLAGRPPEAEQAKVHAATRKKDAPDRRDAEGVRRFLAAQQEQTGMAQRRRPRGGRVRRLVAAAADPLPGGYCAWSAPASAAAAYPYQLAGASARPRRPLLRVAVDCVASVAECRHAIGACVLGIDPIRIDDPHNASDPRAAAYNGEHTLLASPPRALRATLGEGARRLVELLLWRVREALNVNFGEARGSG